MDMRRMLPIILIAFVGLLFVQSFFAKGGGPKTLSTKDRSSLTRSLVKSIDGAQVAHFAKTGEYTASLADLLAQDTALAKACPEKLAVTPDEKKVPDVCPLNVGADIKLSVGSSGAKSYTLLVTSDLQSQILVRTGAKVTTNLCRALKGSSGVSCTDPVPKKDE